MDDREEEEVRVNSYLFQSPIHMRCSIYLASQKTSWEVKSSTLLLPERPASWHLPCECFSSLSLCSPLALLREHTLSSRGIVRILLSQALFSGEPRKSLPGSAT